MVELPDVHGPPPTVPTARRRRSMGGIATVGLLAAMLVGSGVVTPSGLLGWAAGFVASSFVIVAVHELGHLVGGWSGGGVFLLVSAGPLLWRRTPTGVRFHWNRTVHPRGGATVCLPIGRAFTRAQQARMLAAGPLANLVLGLALVAATAVAPAHPVGGALGLLGGGSVLFAIANLVSRRPGADGARLRALVGRTPAADQALALAELTSLGLAGVRPSLWPAEVLARANQLGDGSGADLHGRLARGCARADRGELADAWADLVSVAESASATRFPSQHAAAHHAVAELLARHTPHVGLARAWIDAAPSSPFSPASRTLALAWVLRAEGDAVGAAVHARQARRELEERWVGPVVPPHEADALRELCSTP